MIGVVAHDAGGAELLSSYVRREGLKCLYCLAGPAKIIFERKLGKIENVEVAEIFARCKKILFGTSILSDFEWQAIELSQNKNIRTAAFLEHWVNFRERFTRGNKVCFPDEIWVGDEVAKEIAEREIPEIPIKLVPNPYLLDISEAFQDQTKCSKRSGLRILYLCEPFRREGLLLHGDERYWGHTEEEVLNHFFVNLEDVPKEVFDRITLRNHPREEEGKYRWVKKKYDLPIFVDEGKSLEQQISEHDIVVGGATMAMVVALEAGKRVICSLPSNSRTVRLPYAKIETISDFARSLYIPK